MTSDVRRGMDEAEKNTLARGVSVFAGVAMLLSGVMSILVGITGIARDAIYSLPAYEYRFSLTAWGWIHLIVGIALVAVGAGILSRKAWSRWAGITVASVSLIIQFAFIPYAPVWSIAVMALDLLVIWALARIATFEEHG